MEYDNDFDGFMIDQNTKVRRWVLKEWQENYLSFPIPKKINAKYFTSIIITRGSYNTNEGIIMLEWHFKITIKTKTGNPQFSPTNRHAVDAYTEVLKAVDDRVKMKMTEFFVEDFYISQTPEQLERSALTLLGYYSN